MTELPRSLLTGGLSRANPGAELGGRGSPSHNKAIFNPFGPKPNSCQQAGILGDKPTSKGGRVPSTSLMVDRDGQEQRGGSPFGSPGQGAAASVPPHLSRRVSYVPPRSSSAWVCGEKWHCLHQTGRPVCVPH